MTQYECTQCGQLGRFWQENDAFRTVCPVCEEETTWTRAFDGDAQGVSF